jgi:YD repeat-containing protein
VSGTPETLTVTAAYDAYGNIVSITDQLGTTTGYTYDAFDRLAGITLPPANADDEPSSAAVSRNDAENVVTTTDERGYTTVERYTIWAPIVRSTNAKIPGSTITSKAQFNTRHGREVWRRDQRRESEPLDGWDA